MIGQKTALKYLEEAKEKALLPSPKIEIQDCIHESELSSVWKLKDKSRLYVAKMSLKENLVAEKVFYEKWCEQGVKTPVVVGAYRAKEELPVSMIVTEFIDKPILEDAKSEEELLKAGLYREMGSTLAKMSLAYGKGFGKPKVFDEANGENATFELDMREELGTERMNFLLTRGLINEEGCKHFVKAKAVLQRDFDNGLAASLAHNDLRPYNIFYNQPLIVFDPNCRFKHYAWDLALTLLKQLLAPKYGEKGVEEIVKGYQKVRKVEKKQLNAALYLRGLRLLYSWANKGKDIKKLASILAEISNR